MSHSAARDGNRFLICLNGYVEPTKQEAEDSKSEVGGAEDLQPLQPHWLAESVVLVEGLPPA